MKKDIIQEVKSGGTEVLNDIYKNYKSEFLLYLKKSFSIENEEAIEIFQFVVVTFYENIINGKLIELTSTLKTYLFAIGKYQAMELKKKTSKNLLYDLSNFDFRFEEDIDHEKNELYYLQIEKSINALNELCRNILNYFYYDKKSLIEISELLGYSNPASVKNQKYRCFQKLKELVTQESND